MNRKILLYIYLCLALFCSCNRGQKGAFINESATVELKYAEGFTIEKFEDYSVVSVANPWNEEKFLQRYILVPKSVELPDNLPSEFSNATIVRTPIDKIVVYTSVHASILEELGATDKIIGVCEPQYLTSQRIKELVKDGAIENIGEAYTPNIEKIIDIGTEVILATPFENSGYGVVEKLGIPIIECADYMESTPLGRTEWIKFFGYLLCEEDSASSLFSATEDIYNGLKELATTANSRPTVITERKYGSTWGVPGGNSYMATILSDAGADYIFKDNDKKGSVNLSFETVLNEASEADFWLIKNGYDMSYEDLRAEYQPYEYFAPFKNRTIFTCNTITTPYYDEIVLNPEYLLADIIKIFHPEIPLTEYPQRYFFPMK